MNGKKVKNMEKEFKLTLMEQNKKVNGKKINNTEKEFGLMLMETNMKENLRMGKC